MDNSKIKSVISLPKHTFAPSGVPTISTSVLFIKKFEKEYFDDIKELKNKEDIEAVKKKYNYLDYNIFMAVANEIGYEPNGTSTRSCINDLNKILQEYKETSLNKGFYPKEKFVEISSNSIVVNSSLLRGRIDAKYYWFNHQLSKRKFSHVKLGNYIEKGGRVCYPKKDYPEERFSIVSVTNSHGVILDEGDEKKYEVEGSNITNAKIVNSGDIVYNPYRVNVGSLGVVPDEYDGRLVSSAYVVFKTKNNLDSKVLCALLKNKFYQDYIDIYGIGTIRTSLGWNKLKEIIIPKSIIGNVPQVNNAYNEIDKLKEDIKRIERKMQEDISGHLI